MQNSPNWEEVRSQFPILESRTYLNTAFCGLLSSETEARLNVIRRKFIKEAGNYRLKFIAQDIPKIRLAAANLINAQKRNVALIQSFSIGLNLLVQALPFKKILAVKNDYPGLILPLELGNFEMTYVQLSENQLFNDLKILIEKDRPELVVVSEVQYSNGYRLNIPELKKVCQEYGAKLLVDGTQALGITKIDVSNCDVFIASTYKWLLSGYGCGIMYMSDTMLELCSPKSGGYNTFQFGDEGLTYRESIYNYEPGHKDHESFSRLGVAIQQINLLGIDVVENRISTLMAYLKNSLKNANIEFPERDPSNELGIMILPCEKSVYDHLKSNDIDVALRGKGIRISLHYYNNEEDIDRLVSVLS